MRRRCSVFTFLPAFILLAGILVPALARGDQDEIESPWGTVHADLSGTAATTGIPYTLGEGSLEEKWRLDIQALGQDRAAGRASLTFDKDGNIYWITLNGGGTGGVIRLASASPDGNLRWFGNDGLGNVHALGATFSGTSPVVGNARVYALGDVGGSLQVAAYNKATGQNIWTADLTPSVVTSGMMLTPVLYKGKLYVAGLNGGATQDFYQIDAETGSVEWSTTVPEVAVLPPGTPAVGQMAFVPDAFGAGVHGLYFNGSSGGAVDGIADAYGIKIDTVLQEASLGWAAEGGHVARSHVIYSSQTNRLYTLTWGDKGKTFYVFDPVTGFVVDYQNISGATPGSGHGFYDVGGLDFDGASIIGGGFAGEFFRYIDDLSGIITDELIYKSNKYSPPYWGESRVLGQLLQDGSGNTILITATNSFQCCPSHVIALDVTNKALLWEYDTKNFNDHQYLYAGGPVMGPDGKIYFFERPNTGTTALVAIGKAAAPVPPTAGFMVLDSTGASVGFPPDRCIKADEVITVDGFCSTGKDLVYRYATEPPDSAVIDQASDTDSVAKFQFKVTGQIKVILQVENADGIGEYGREVCVEPVAPICSVTILNRLGGQIDDKEDTDTTPCLPVGEIANVDATRSTGGDLVYGVVVTPTNGVVVDSDPARPTAVITFGEAGIFKITASVSNSLGDRNCAQKTVCVAAPQVPQNLQVTDKVEKIALTWDKVTDGSVQGYVLYKADAEAGPFQKLTEPALGKDVNTYTDTSVAVGEDYFYRVRAIYALAESADSNTASAVVETAQPQVTWKRCDANGDGTFDISDPVASLGAQFLGDTVKCVPALDCNNDAAVDLSDVVFDLAWQFLGGPKPADPYPACEKFEGCVYDGSPGATGNCQ